VMDWLRPYLVMRILGVYSLVSLEPSDATLSLGLLAEALDPTATLPGFLGVDRTQSGDAPDQHAHGGPR